MDNSSARKNSNPQGTDKLPVRKKLGRSQQEDILTLIALDNSTDAQQVVKQIDPLLFSEGMPHDIAERVIAYWAQHGRAPGEAHIESIFGDKLDSKLRREADKFDYFVAQMRFLYSRPDFNRKFVREHAVDWIVRQRTKEQILNAAFALDSGEPTEEVVRRVTQLDDLPALAKGRKSKLAIRRAADIDQRPLTWVFNDFIPEGKLTLLAGKPDVGKSLLSLDLAACISTGVKLPNGQRAPQGNVIILSAEDVEEDTIVPRLEAALADLRYLHTIDVMVSDISTRKQRMLDLARDIALIADKIDEVGDVRLVIFDTITSYLGNINTNLESQVRATLTPLAKLAAEKNVAVLGIIHFRKDATGSALDRVIGTTGYGALVRSVLGAVPDPKDEHGYLFYRIKGNLADKHGVKGYAYKIRSCTVKSGERLPYIEWQGPTDVKIADALDPEHLRKRDDAVEFLYELLADGPVESKEVERAGKELGYSMATLRRAQKETKDIKVKKPRERGHDAPWEWYIEGSR